MLVPDVRPNVVVCWGGHSISRVEYDYTKDVGYHLGLRGLDICTGCGPGAMKGPMKGAAIGHVKQRTANPRYIGLTEPGIIAAEPPNPMVNHLVVLPDIEKRLEAFVRMGHAFIVIFPGGVGTVEEVLYLLGLLMDPTNVEQNFPVDLHRRRNERQLFREPRPTDHVDARRRGAPALSHRHRRRAGCRAVGSDARSARCRASADSSGDAYYFNWLLRIPLAWQKPFDVTHENVAALRLRRDLPPHELAFNLKRAFSAIVTGNVKENGIRMIRERGPFILHGDRDIMDVLDKVLGEFVAQGRMKLPGARYECCFQLATD